MTTIIDESWYSPPLKPVRTRYSAGGVVLRREGGVWLVALAREADFPTYVLPKGGIEAGEEPEQTARREIAEEAGIRGLVLCGELGRLERWSYRKTLWLVTHMFAYITDDVGSAPTDAAAHPHPAAWFPLKGELPPMLWPDQARLLRERADALIAQATRALQTGP